jgi:hypothetical protein
MIESSDVEWEYYIKEITDDYIVVDDIESGGTLSSILSWSNYDIKPVVKLTNSNGEYEYVNITKIINSSTSPEEYTLYYNSRDITKRHLDNVQLTGTVSLTSGSATLTGTNTEFKTELKYGTIITIDGETYTVSSVTNDELATLTTSATEDYTDESFFVDTLPDYEDGDSLMFATYVLIYRAEPKDLEYLEEEDDIDEDLKELIIYYAAYRAFTMAIKTDLASQKLDMYMNIMNEKMFRYLEDDYNMENQRLF